MRAHVLTRVLLVAGLAAGLLASRRSQAQQFDPFQGQAAAYQAQFTRYFASPEAELLARQTLLDSVRTFARDTVWTPPTLGAHLDQYEHLLARLRRHTLYRRLSALRDREDAAARADLRALTGAGDDLGQGLDRGVGALAPAALAPAHLAAAGLGRYAYLLGQVRAPTAPTLPPVARRAVAEVTDPLRETLTARYDRLLDQWSAASRPAPGPALDAATAAAQRAQQAQTKLLAYDAHAELLAATLLDLTQLNQRLARQAGFASAPDQVYRRRLQLGEAAVKPLLAELARHPEALHRYQQVQQARVRQATGLAQVHSWDLAAALPYTPPPLTLATARQRLLAALRPLGPAYGQQFARLTDPANGMLDLTGGAAHRTTENTALGFVQAPTTLYMKTFDGSARSLSVLIHEGGHAVHRELMSRQGIVPSYGSGPSFLFEAFALFNELLLLDELQRASQTVAERHYYGSLLCEKLAHEVFTSAQEGAFEQGLYEGVAAGTLTTRADVDSLYARIMTPYDLFFAAEPARRSEWVGKRLVFDDPLYNVTYLYAMLVAAKLYQQLHARPRWFVPRYLALLQHGFDAPAEELLQRHLGFGLDERALLGEALQVLDTQLTSLQR